MTAPANPATLPAPVQVMTLDDFPVFVMQGAQYEYIEGTLGHNHYFVLQGSSENKLKADGKTTEKVENTKLFRVTNSQMGRAIVDASLAQTGFKFSTVQQFENKLPAIPYDMYMQMDAFFREVHKKHGTEAIVMLVFDENFFGTDDPSAGWGIAVPEQKNTGGHCNYDPLTITDHLPDNVFLAGSAHSHPLMSAYASGTDHADQAGWDGVHITYGWQTNVNKGATEIYIEIQYANKKWAVDRDEVIQPAPKYEIDTAEVEGWVGKVSKAGGATNFQGSHGGRTSVTPPPSSYQHGASGASSVQNSNRVVHRAPVQLPDGAPDPTAHYLIGVLTGGGTHKCPFCKNPLGTSEREHGRCFACYNFIIVDDQTLEEFNERRTTAGARALSQLDLKNSDKPIVLWSQTVTDGTTVNTFSEDMRIGAAKK